MDDTTAMADPDSAPRATDAHDDHAGGHGHGSSGESLGPLDVVAWGYAVLGAAVGVLVALALFIAHSS